MGNSVVFVGTKLSVLSVSLFYWCRARGERFPLYIHTGDDPLGPLLFSLAFRSTLESIQKSFPYTYITAYLDDVYILSKTAGVKK